MFQVQVKMLESNSLSILETEVNTWLNVHPYKILQISYSGHDYKHYALITYEKKMFGI